MPAVPAAPSGVGAAEAQDRRDDEPTQRNLDSLEVHLLVGGESASHQRRDEGGGVAEEEELVADRMEALQHGVAGGVVT